MSDAGPVLVAVDFSPDSEAALLWACAHAACLDAPLLILHVVHDPAAAPGFYRKDNETENWTEPMSAAAERLMAEFMARMTEEHRDVALLKDAATALVTGLPPGRIVDVAKKEQAQLIVVGNRGRTGLPHVMLGSVAERVAQLAPMPVVIVKRDETQDPER